ncbi:unnamed protein product [Cyclocybe aegerita]|uniref:VHS domain-containing protein n=1 Tax=Cyclocybe aegerita TaxID=1973307 RepID=A0A8S0WUA7_CYCAE|nr:unnamed protein product [Cyclocybe aegerita]
MSALSFAKQAFGRDKPHSSITDWVDILTSPNIQEEAYDGIPELVDAINLQAASGPTEASRALRKKLKHGNAHQQYRAMVLLKALVENCGQKFQSTFADGHLTDAIKHLANDYNTDKRVKKKVLLVLASWREQYKDDPSMSTVAGLYRQCRGAERRPVGQQELAHMMGLSTTPEEKRKSEKEEAKKLAKQREKEEEARRLEEAKKKKRVPFDFEKDKPKVLASIVEGSQASSNLVNAITLVNLQTDSLLTNERVQECLTKAKQARKPVVRYIQLVENEEVIGTLIETNDRIVSALEMYEQLSAPATNPESEETAAVTPRSEPSPRAQDDIFKGKERSVSETAPTHVHPDLEDLNFGALGGSSTRLPAPMRPSTALSDEGFENEQDQDRRGSLSDFSDYESSDEETHRANAGSWSKSKRNYVTVSDNEEETAVPFASGSRKQTNPTDDDPFADPFADEKAIRT